MPPRKKSEDEATTDVDFDDISADLITALNKDLGQRVAYNLSNQDSPTIVKHWIPTGSMQLDYAISNRPNGGYPSGRIIEIAGPPSTGKSHLALAAAKSVQEQGGLVVYIDTENATPIEKLSQMGLDVSRRFVYCDTHCTEEVFQIAENVITKASSLSKNNKPILVVWDSVAATSPKQELQGEYDKDTVGLQARVISKSMRKITGHIGKNGVTFMCLNQIRQKIGVMFGDPTTTPGGMAIPFHASVRIMITGSSLIKDGSGAVIGITVKAKINKNKVAAPFRKVEFDIIFGEGINENESLYFQLKDASKKKPIVVNGKGLTFSDSGAMKKLTITDDDTGEVIEEKKFYKSKLNEFMQDETYGPLVRDAVTQILMNTKIAHVEIEESSNEQATHDD